MKQFILCLSKRSSNPVELSRVQIGQPNFMEIREKISFPSFIKKMLMSAFLLKFKANYLEKMHGCPSFSLWIPIALQRTTFTEWS